MPNPTCRVRVCNSEVVTKVSPSFARVVGTRIAIQISRIPAIAAAAVRVLQAPTSVSLSSEQNQLSHPSHFRLQPLSRQLTTPHSQTPRHSSQKFSPQLSHSGPVLSATSTLNGREQFPQVSGPSAAASAFRAAFCSANTVAIRALVAANSLGWMVGMWSCDGPRQGKRQA